MTHSNATEGDVEHLSGADAAVLARLYGAELALTHAAAAREGLAGLVRAAGDLCDRPQWLLDTVGRVVACTPRARELSVPPLTRLLQSHDTSGDRALLVPADPAHGLARRHLLAPVRRDGVLHAWWIVAELPRLFEHTDQVLATRTALHLASEYDTQRRVARTAHNARSLLARQLVRGSGMEDDLVASGDHLGIDVNSRRLVVFVAHPQAPAPGSPSSGAAAAPDETRAADRLAAALGVEVLGTRGNEGTILLVQVPTDRREASFVEEVKDALRRGLVTPEPTAVPPAVGISCATDRRGLRREYRAAREVARCVERFCLHGERLLAVDDLGPARLFVANAREADVRAYVTEVLGPLLDGDRSRRVLLETVDCYFLHDRSVRRTARSMSVHENTVRLRLARVGEETGLDVAGNARDQLSVQTALLVLQLTGVLPVKEAAAADAATAAAAATAATSGRSGSRRRRIA